MSATLHNDAPVITRQWLLATLSPLVSQFHDDAAECGEDFLSDDEIISLLISDLSRLIATSCEREMRIAETLTGEEFLPAVRSKVDADRLLETLTEAAKEDAL
jgi:hypothetical protein